MGPGTIYVMVNAARYFRGPGIFQEVTGKETRNRYTSNVKDVSGVHLTSLGNGGC